MRHDNNSSSSRWGQDSRNQKRQQGSQRWQSPGTRGAQQGSEQSRGSLSRDYRNLGSEFNDDFQNQDMPFGPEGNTSRREDREERKFNQGYGGSRNQGYGAPSTSFNSGHEARFDRGFEAGPTGSRRSDWGSGTEDISSRGGFENNRYPGQFSDPHEYDRNRSNGWEERTMTGSVPRDDAYYSGQGVGGYGQNETFGSLRNQGHGARTWSDHQGLESEQYRTNSRGMMSSSRREPTSSSSGWGSGSESERGRHFGKGPKGYSRSDERIREEICECLHDAGEIDASNIEIRVEKGEITLSGSVETRQEKRLAEDLIENVSGVREVNNQIKVGAKSNSSSQESKSGSENTREIGSTQKSKVA